MQNFGGLLNTKAIMAFVILGETSSHFKPVILVEFRYIYDNINYWLSLLSVCSDFYVLVRFWLLHFLLVYLTLNYCLLHMYLFRKPGNVIGNLRNFLGNLRNVIANNLSNSLFSTSSFLTSPLQEN